MLNPGQLPHPKTPGRATLLGDGTATTLREAPCQFRQGVDPVGDTRPNICIDSGSNRIVRPSWVLTSPMTVLPAELRTLPPEAQVAALEGRDGQLRRLAGLGRFDQSDDGVGRLELEALCSSAGRDERSAAFPPWPTPVSIEDPARRVSPAPRGDHSAAVHATAALHGRGAERPATRDILRRRRHGATVLPPVLAGCARVAVTRGFVPGLAVRLSGRPHIGR